MYRWLSILLVAVGAFGISACSGDGNGNLRGTGGFGGDPLECSDFTMPPPGCDDPCPGGDSECQDGTFCFNGVCSAQCTAEQGCGEGSYCNVRGRCISNDGTGGTSGTGGSNGCQSVQVTPTRSIPNVMFLVDQSGSMRYSLQNDSTPPSGEPDRWEAAHTAITQIISELESIVRFGLTTYQSANGGATPAECPIFGPAVGGPVGFFDLNQAAGPIGVNYPASFPGGEDTPTGDSIDVLVDWIEQPANTPPTDGPTIIVLATDGEPDSCETPDPNPTPQARTEAVNAAAAAHAPPPNGAGIDVFVLWVGKLDDMDTENHLQDVANAGVEGTGTVWVGEKPESLESAFRQIIKDSISCEIEINKPFDDVNIACSQGDVRLNGIPLSCPSEWRVKPGVDNVIELVGGACDTFKSGDSTFTAVFPCGAIVVE